MYSNMHQFLMERKWERIHVLVVKMNNSSALKPFLEKNAILQ